MRDDGRFYLAEMGRDLFGTVVLIAHGGRHTPARVRSIPVEDAAAGLAVIERLEKRRRAHGYRPAGAER